MAPVILPEWEYRRTGERVSGNAWASDRQRPAPTGRGLWLTNRMNRYHPTNQIRDPVEAEKWPLLEADTRWAQWLHWKPKRPV